MNKGASRSDKRTRIGLDRQCESGRPSRNGEACTEGQATSEYSPWALRGVRGQHVPKDQPRNLGDPQGCRCIFPGGVGSAHSSREAGQLPWSEGAVLDTRFEQNERRTACLTRLLRSTWEGWSRRWKPTALSPLPACPSSLREKLQRKFRVSGRAGCGKSARPVR